MSYKGKLNNVKLVAGRSNMPLAKLISEKLKIPLLSRCLDDFANKELRVELYDNIRNFDIFIVQTGSSNSIHSINDHLMELVAIADACRLSSARTITAVVPFYPYSRSDKKDAPRVPIMGAAIARILESVGINRIVSMDLHSGQIQGFTKMPFDNLFAINLHIENLNNSYFKNMTNEEINNKYVLVAPDNGGIKRIEAYAKKLKMKFVTMHKQRDYSQKNVVNRTLLIGDDMTIKNKIAILIDDMVDTMGTMTASCQELKNKGIKEVIIIATHGIFSNPAFERINKCDMIKKVIVTNTLDQDNSCKTSNKIEVVDTSDLFSNVIQRLISGSISDLFK